MAFKLLVLIAILIVAISEATFSPQEMETDQLAIKNSLLKYFNTGKVPNFLIDALKRYNLLTLRGHFEEVQTKTIISKGACTFCNVIVDVLVIVRHSGISKKVIASKGKFLCKLLSLVEPEINERVCNGLVDLNIDTLLYIIDNMEIGNGTKRFCGVALQSLGCTGGPNDFQWSINIPSGKSIERPELETISKKTFNVLHLTDYHYDPMYKPRGNAKCHETLCCQNDQRTPLLGKNFCGHWTDYRKADVPWHLVEESLRQVNTHEFDYVYFTGDIIGHRVWSTSVQANANDIRKLMKAFKEKFTVPVYPVLGNHEPSPVNLFSPIDDPNFSTQWLFSLAAQEWGHWLGEEAAATILKGGYYTVSPKKGFRIIGLNSNVCYILNWWLIYDDVDPFGQLQWLADTLKSAEDNNESVHILSHIPSGDETCLKSWSRNYRKIVERFANTITGQFNGHTHEDTFQVFYKNSSTTLPEAIGVAFNGASLTPYENFNPNYKLYNVDQSTYTIHDYEEWTFDLDQANSRSVKQSPDWYKLYSFTEAYGVPNALPKEVGKVVEEMARNHTLLDMYRRYKFRNNVKGSSQEKCQKQDCLKSELCKIAITQVGENTHCNYFTEIYDKNV